PRRTSGTRAGARTPAGDGVGGRARHPDAHGGHARATAARQAWRGRRSHRNGPRFRLPDSRAAKPARVRLASRLLAGSIIVVTMLVAAIVIIAGGRLHSRLLEEKTDELSRDARLVAAHWLPGVDADSLAHVDGAALGYRVTLIDSSGTVVGDAEFSPDARRRLENHATRPEVVAARGSGIGVARRQSASAGDEELYV